METLAKQFLIDILTFESCHLKAKSFRSEIVATGMKMAQIVCA